MPSAQPRARKTRFVAAAMIALVALTGCTATTTDSKDEVFAATTKAEEGAFPVTIKHALGEATLAEEPKRVVTMGWAAEDAVVALGVVPVAVPAYGWGADADGYLPWFRDAVEKLDAPLPETLKAEERSGEVNFEQLLDLKPDVILAPFSGITEEDYKRLSDIAPTVAYDKEVWASSWQELTTTVGTALGRPALAAEIVADTKGFISDKAQSHPEFDGVTFGYGMAMTEGDSGLTLYFPADPRVELIEGLGFVTPQSIKDVAAKSEYSSSDSISLELLGDLTGTDTFIAWSGSEEDKKRTLENPLIAEWGPVAAGKDLVLTDPSLVWATSSPTALNISWALDELVPQLSELVKR